MGKQRTRPDILRPRPELRPLSPERQARANAILDRFGIPPDERADFQDAVAALTQIAFDAYLVENGFKASIVLPGVPTPET